MKVKLTVGIILQLIGVASSFLVSETFDPNFGARHSDALRNRYSGLADQYFNNHVIFMVFGYIPFGILGLIIGLPGLLRYYPQSLSAKQKRTFAVLALFTSIPLVSSIPGYFVVVTGGAIPKQEALMFAVTPIALALLMSGSLGLFMLATLPKHLNSKTGAWLRLIIGSALIFMSWNFLEILLRISYIK